MPEYPRTKRPLLPDQSTEKMKSFCVVAGEPSGDAHGAILMQALREVGAREDVPMHFWGLGGALMCAEGFESLTPIDDIAVMGVGEVFRSYPKISSVMKRLERRIKYQKPDAIILIDYPGFNLRLIQNLKSLNIPFFYHIPPKVWAHGRERAAVLAACCRLVTCILPFEETTLRSFGVRAEFVGNPLRDNIAPLVKQESAEAFGGSEPPKIWNIALCPGSRKHEIDFLLPLFLKSLGELRRTFKGSLQAWLPLPLGMHETRVKKHLSEAHEDITVVPGGMYEVMSMCHYAWIASGTATLEAAFFGVPMSVCYRVHPVTAWLAKRLLKVKWVSLVNLCAQTTLVPEFLQQEAHVTNLTTHAAQFLGPEHWERNRELRHQLLSLRDQFPLGAAQRAAQSIWNAL